MPGLQRGAKFDLLATLGRLGVYEMRAGSLFFSGSDEVTLAAKRLLGIGDPMLLDRRAAALAEACGLPLEALDVGFYNWERGERATLGMDPADRARSGGARGGRGGARALSRARSCDSVRSRAYLPVVRIHEPELQ